MEIEELFLILSCLMLFFDIVQLSKAKKSGRKSTFEYGFYAATLACGLIATSYFLLLQAFLTDDFRLIEVYSYSSTGLPATSKLYATWGGASSSMLFLTFLTGIVYFVYRFRTHDKRRALDLTAYKLLNFILIFFVVIILMNSPFQRFSGAPMDGAGLNPLLQTFWMLVHPPVVFAGYVFIILAFVLTLGSMNSGENVNSRFFRLLLHCAWLITTLGIAIGGVWAYEVLGWGGYWAWDPVETASLLPWLGLTAYFHLGSLSEFGKSLSRELLLLITFAAVIFGTALTRGGLLVSVHAFGSSPIGPVFLLLALGMAIYFFYLKAKIKKPLFSLKVEKSSLYSVSLLVGFLSLVFIFLVCFWGVAFPIIGGLFLSSSLAIDVLFYNTWNFPFVMSFVAGLIGCSLHQRIGFKKIALLVAGALVLGAFLVQVQRPTPNALANLGTPLLIVGLVATLFRMVEVLPRKQRSLRQFGRSMLHLAIIITLIGVFFSSTTQQVTEISDAKPNTQIQTLGLTIDLKNFTVFTGTGNVHSIQYSLCVPEYSALKMDITINQEGRIYHSALWVRYYTLYGIVSPTLIITTLNGDIYMRMLHTESIRNSLLQALDGRQVMPQDLILSVEVNPAVYLVWTGVTLMSIGIAVPFVRDLLRAPTKKEKS